MTHGGGLNFIDSNPAIEGMAQANQVIGGQTANDLNSMQLQELMRTRDVEHSIDEAIRQQLGQGGQPGVGQPADLGAMSMGPQPQPTMQGQSMPRGTATPAAPGATPPVSFAAQHPQMDVGRATPVPGGNAMVPVPNATPGQGQMAPMAGAPADLSTMAMWDRPQSPARINAGIDRVALARRLAQIPGGGAYAMQLIDQDQKDQQTQQQAALERQDHAVTNYFKSIENGDTYSAKYWGKQAGMDTPDDVLHDADFQKFMGQASKWKEFYSSDLQGFHDFYQTALKMHGAGDPDAFQKAYRAVPPTEKAAKGAFEDKNAEIDYLIKNLHYTQDQAARAVGLSPDGSGRGRGGGGSVWQLKHDSYLRTHPGDENGAQAFASGARQISYKEARTMAQQQALYESDHGGWDDAGTTLDSRIKDLTEIIMSDDPTFQQGGGAPGAQPATAGDAFALAQQAYDAIAKGADAGQVKARYRQQTGKDLPEQGTQ